MTQNQNANISAPKQEHQTLPTTLTGAAAGRLRGRGHKSWPLWLTGLFVVAGLVKADVTNVHASTTATQAVISYSAPDNAACTIDVREGDFTGPVVPDVDPSLFPAANLNQVSANRDSRPLNIISGQRRIFVVGKRVAEFGLDGFRHSRALQTNSAHSFKITCGSSTYSGQFTTMNAPLGVAYNDPLPVDPFNPGHYAWPDFRWNDRNQWIVDPLTGFRLKQFDSPRDAYEVQGSGSFVSASNAGGGTDWTNPNSIVADDSAVATYSGTTQGFLFAELGLAFLNSAGHTSNTSSPNTFVPTFNAYCSSPDCATATDNDRSIEFCLTIDGFSCSSDLLPAVLRACSTGCTGNNFRFAGIPNATPILTEWFPSRQGVPNLDGTDLSKRTGSVNRSGATVTLAFGDRFNLNWKPGSHITVNGVVYTIASVNHDSQVTLAGSPTGTDTFVPYVGSNAGMLIRKKTQSTHQISVQSVTYAYEVNEAPILEDAGDEDSYANCSPNEVPGPGGELGIHCSVSSTMYWVGSTTATVNRLGRSVLYYNPADDGWNRQVCSFGSFWDWNDPNAFYCPGLTLKGHALLFKFAYTGNNTDIGDLRSDQEPVRCNGSNAPCWTVTNLTPGAMALDLQLADFVSTDWNAAKFHTNSIAIFGRMNSADSLTFLARRDQINDSMGIVFRFDITTGKIAGAVPTWAHYPLRWSGMHGPFDLNDPKYIQVSGISYVGSFTGVERIAGQGPYFSTVTTPAGIDDQNHPCPARPASSPIPASEWPVGNQCITLTVDGEPGDPTPAQYFDGAINVSGTQVTGVNTAWSAFMDGTQLRIGSSATLYKFTWGGLNNPNQGTLDSAPGDVLNSPYIIYLEPIGNPKVGNPNYAYLQDADVRDVFCVTNKVACDQSYYLPPGSNGNEFMRLILKDPNNSKLWTLQRGWAGTNPQKPLRAMAPGAYLVTESATCNFVLDIPCSESRVLWNAIDDPYGLNVSNTTVVKDTGDQGCCHSARQNGVNVDVGNTCPARAGNGNIGCYFARYSGPPAAFTDPGYPVSNNPVFHQRVGIGSPNAVDSHPSHNQTSVAASPNELRWIGDARPFLGDNLLGSTSNPQGTLLSGTLYKFTASQVSRLNPRVLPTMAYCGANPLLDISGPASSLGATASDNYKYCVVGTPGECASGSSAGDLYLNCPQMRFASCSYAGIGNSDPDSRDMCVGDLGAMAMNVVQVGVDRPDPDGVNGRRVTEGLGRYKWLYTFWNAKILPNGKWMLVWSTFAQGQRTSVFIVKLPPFPQQDGINRGDYIPQKVIVPAPKVPGATVTNAVVQFGYDTNYYCTSRREACVQGGIPEFAYQGENPPGVACTNGCTISVPAISQRVLYYQVLLRNASNQVVGQMAPEAVAIR